MTTKGEMMNKLTMETMMEEHDDMMNITLRDKIRNVLRLGKKTVRDNKDNIKAAGVTVKDTAETVIKSETTKEFGRATKQTLLDAIRSEEFKTLVVWTMMGMLTFGLLLGWWMIGAALGVMVGFKKLILG